MIFLFVFYMNPIIPGYIGWHFLPLFQIFIPKEIVWFCETLWFKLFFESDSDG